METGNYTTITIEAIVNAPDEKVWRHWTEPEYITKWNNASDGWRTLFSENDLQVGGKFLSRMEAKDESFGFDLSGVYDEVDLNKFISYTLDDGRQVKVILISQENQTKIIQTFEAETTNSIEFQKNGWQSILNNFKEYIEGV